MKPGPSLIAAKHFLRLSARTFPLRLGALLTAATCLWTAIDLLAGTHASLILQALPWLVFAAACASAALLSPQAPTLVATRRQMTLRGLAPRSQWLGRALCRCGVGLLSLLIPSAVFCACLLFYSQSLSEAGAIGLALIGLAVASAASAVTLEGLAWLSAAVSPARPGTLLLSLVLLPELLSSALPALPNWFAVNHWLFTSALSPVSG